MATDESLSQSKGDPFGSSGFVSWYGEDDLSPRLRQLQLALGDESADPRLKRGSLGSFRLISIIASGGTGTVYSAVDLNTGSPVALKVLHPTLMQRPHLRMRFEKEARLQSNLNSPHLVRLLEVAEDDGERFLVMELVEGITLNKLLASHGKFDERTTLKLILPVLRGLTELHRVGIVHRDVKPANILVNSEVASNLDSKDSMYPVGSIKLTDFGLARSIVQADSLDLTAESAIVGTPHYGAPEQAAGEAVVTLAADVYAVGTTLFHLLTGRTVFESTNALEVLESHRHARPPAIESFSAAVSDGLCRVVAKALEKQPRMRYSSAAEMALDIERLMQGQPTSIQPFGRAPSRRTGPIRTYELRCELISSPLDLWPYISNTDRVNQAVNLPAAHFSREANSSGQPIMTGSMRYLGLSIRWREHPFEWIEQQQMSVLREFSSGPLLWLESTVWLTPRLDGGCSLIHRFQYVPANVLGKAIGAVQIGWISVRAFARLYQRIDSVLSSGQVRSTSCDAFVPAHRLTGRQQKRLEAASKRLQLAPLRSQLGLHMVEYISQAAAQEVSRMRPLELARRWQIPTKDVVEAFLYAASSRLLKLGWDIHCPVCRSPAAMRSSLSEVEASTHCDVCNVDFKTDFAHFVELVFSVDPSIRRTETRTFCTGGPAHAPHVVAQVVVCQRRSVSLPLSLNEGTYRIRSSQLSQSHTLHVSRTATQVEFTATFLTNDSLKKDAASMVPNTLTEGLQVLTIENQLDQDVVIRVERSTTPENVLTAAKATSLSLFRELFPNEVVGFDRPVALDRMHILAVEVSFEGGSTKSPSNVGAYAGLQIFFAKLDDLATAHGGVLFKTIGTVGLVVFAEPDDANDATKDLLTLVEPPLQIRALLNRGPAVLANINGKLEYLGATVQSSLSELAETEFGTLRRLNFDA